MGDSRAQYEKYREYQRKYAKDNAERKTLQSKGYVRRMRLAALEILGGECVRCGFDDYRALQIDHINGNGTKERKSMTKNYHKAVIASVLNNENKYQLLCANCNWIKRVENNEIKNGI